MSSGKVINFGVPKSLCCVPNRILAIPSKLLHISLTNPKISKLDLEISKKYKNRHRISDSDAGFIISPFFCVVSFANVKNIGLSKVYHSRSVVPLIMLLLGFNSVF